MVVALYHGVRCTSAVAACLDTTSRSRHGATPRPADFRGQRAGPSQAKPLRLDIEDLPQLRHACRCCTGDMNRRECCRSVTPRGNRDPRTPGRAASGSGTCGGQNSGGRSPASPGALWPTANSATPPPRRCVSLFPHPGQLDGLGVYLQVCCWPFEIDRWSHRSTCGPSTTCARVDRSRPTSPRWRFRLPAITI